MPPSSFVLPKLVYRSTKSAWEGHIAFAFYLIRQLQPRLFVELGTHWGDSYFAFCQGVAEWRLSTRCAAVDTWAGDPHTGDYGDDLYRLVNAHHGSRYGGFSRLLRMKFDEALQHFADGSVDLLHIDGFHTYDAVRHDYETWLPKLSDRGVILFHDTCVRAGDFGVYRLWDELAARYPAFQFTHSNGLGVACVGTQIPSPLAEPCGDPDQADIWRSVFRRWSELLVAENKARRLRRTMAERVKRKLARSWHRVRGMHGK